MTRSAMQRLTGRLNSERGFTLVEMLVAMSTGLIVAAAALAFLLISSDQENATASRSYASSQAEAGLQQMVRDLRNAMYESTTNQSTYYAVEVTPNTTSGTTTLTLDIPTSTSSGVTTASDGSGVQVTWVCPTTTSTTNVGSCTRQVGSGPAQTMITGVDSVNFTPYSSTGSAESLSTNGCGCYYDPGTIKIVLDAQDISANDSTGTHTVVGVQNPIVLVTSADLRNFP